MKIYFAGAIRGGRQKVEDYKKIVDKLEKYGEVLTKHIADTNISSKGESDLTPEQIYIRDKEWLDEADIIVAEVSRPSLGIGYEIGYMLSQNKPVYCFYDTSSEFTLSAMIAGNKEINVFSYSSIDKLLQLLENIF